MNIPDSFQGSAAFQFITSQGFDWKVSNLPNIELESCVYCKKGGYGHFYMEVHGTSSEDRKRDGLHVCHRCGKGGSLFALKQHLGVASPAGMETVSNTTKIDSLPDVDACHQALLEDADAMEYLMSFRGFSREIIEKQKLGLKAKHYFRETGEVRALVYPYLVGNNCVFVHYRTLPAVPFEAGAVPKAFNSPSGWDAVLYNGAILSGSLQELIMVEGEANTIAALDKGIEGIVGAPGAGFKKAEWMTALDSIDRIFICYDKDKRGQKAAQELASRIGVEKCWKINLPDFMVQTDTGETRKGKDLNEWFAKGNGTKEAFEVLKAEARQFDVDGVRSAQDALDEFEEDILEKGMESKYQLPWLKVQTILGMEDGDVLDLVAPGKIGKTTVGLQIMEHMVDKYEEDGVVICIEMSRARMARKWVSHVAQVADNIPKTPEESAELKSNMLAGIVTARAKATGRKGTLYFCYPIFKTPEDIYNVIRDCIRRYGIRWVMFDNVHRLCDLTLGGKNRTIHLSMISKALTQIAKDYNVQMIRILQPNRIEKGKLITTDNVDGSSQIDKDCDAMVTLHRNRIGVVTEADFENVGDMTIETNFSEKMLFGVGLSRYSSGGSVQLYFDGARSTVNEQSSDILNTMAATVASTDTGYKSVLAGIGVQTKEATVPDKIGEPVEVPDMEEISI